jgi:large subunit ribosomal protein L15
MQLHTLKRIEKNKSKKRVGRGGTRGTFSGRGSKGQRARAGGKIRPEFRDIFKKIPKLRGQGKNKQVSRSTKPEVINLDTLSKVFKAGDAITPIVLIDTKVIRKRKGRVPHVKILGRGGLNVSLNISGCVVSNSAREKIIKAGGRVEEEVVNTT